MKPFETPDQTLGTLDTDAVAKLIAATADVALIIDRDGVVVDLAFHDQQLGTELTGSAQWIGMPWIETVTPESRAKVTALLAEAVGTVVPRWRHINHPASNGSMPILYTAVQVGDGRVVAVGRDLKPLASLQQRLVEAQQSMERDYSRLRHVEMRYRLLFQMSLEPFLIIDGTSLRIAEANPAATRLLGQSAAQITGRPLSEAFAAESVQAISALLSVIRATGRADDVRARLADFGIRIRRIGFAVPPGQRAVFSGAPVARADRRRSGAEDQMEAAKTRRERARRLRRHQCGGPDPDGQ